MTISWKRRRGHDVGALWRPLDAEDAGSKYAISDDEFRMSLKKVDRFRREFTDTFQPDYIKISCLSRKDRSFMISGMETTVTSGGRVGRIVIKEIKKTVPYHVRIMRLIRDIPSGHRGGSKIRISQVFGQIAAEGFDASVSAVARRTAQL